MITTACILGASSWPIAVMLALPVVAALLWLASKTARTRLHRLGNLVMGLCGAVAGALSVIFGVAPPMNSWAEEWFGLLIVGGMIVGATAGILLNCVLRMAATQR
jgi:hypothetical protein